MRATLLRPLFIAAALSLCAAGARAQAGREPNLASLRLVTELPEGLPKRVSDLAYDGKKIWVMVYQGRGQHALLDPSKLEWEAGPDRERRAALAALAGESDSPNGVCFAGDRLWVGGALGASLGYLDTRDWKVGRVFRGRQREEPARGTQSYAALACDGEHVWVAWHWYRYDVPVDQTQLLLKVEPATGKVLAEYALPAGAATDGTHALAWDGARLWHMKDNWLSALDPGTGLVTSQYTLPGVKRASGLAWDGRSLWVAEFDGKIWRLLF